MNEDTMAGALFFGLLSIAALIKVDELVGIEGVGLAIGVICAIISAFFLKKSIMQSAIAQEDNHQRLEIQFQQLRNKLNGGDDSNEETIRAINKGSDRLEEELQVIRDKLDVLENLTRLSDSSEEMKSSLVEFVESTQATQELIKKLADNSDAEAKLAKVNVEKMSNVEEKLNNLEENSKKLSELTETNQTTVQTGLKLMQVIGQMLKAPPFAKDLTQLGKSMEALSEKLDKLDQLEKLDKLDALDKLEDLKTSTSDISEKLSGLIQINDNITERGQSLTASVEQLNEVNNGITEEIKRTNENVANLTIGVEKAALDVTTAINVMQEDISKLTTKIDAYNGLMKAAIEQYSSLSEQDVKVLEKIAEKIQ